MDDLAGTRAVTLLGTTRAQGGEHRLPLGGNSPYEPIIRTGDKMPPSPCPSRPCDPPIPLSSGGASSILAPGEIWRGYRETFRFHYATSNLHVDSLQGPRGMTFVFFPIRVQPDTLWEKERSFLPSKQLKDTIAVCIDCSRCSSLSVPFVVPLPLCSLDLRALWPSCLRDLHATYLGAHVTSIPTWPLFMRI